MQALVAKDPVARPQTMLEVQELLERALANVNDGEPFRDGMYGGGDSPTGRGGAGARVREASIKSALSARNTRISGDRSQRGGVLMAAGLPLVEADDRDSFEEWLGVATDAASNRDGYQHAHDRMIMALGGALQRPFFLEGAQLFGGRGLFYSRRIGAAPLGFNQAQNAANYVEPIDNSTILGAAKLTGRLPSGLSVGALAAVTDREEVDTFDEATRSFGSAVMASRACSRSSEAPGRRPV